MSGAAGAAAAGAAGGAAAGGAAAGGAPAAGAGAAGGSGIVSNTAIPGANGAGAAAGADWMSSIENADLKGFAQTKGWKNPGELVDSYRNLEKLRGVPLEQLLTIPKTDDAAAMAAMYDKLGRPANPDGYGFKKDGPEADSNNWMATEFHKLGLTAAQAKGLFDASAARQAALKESSKTELAAKATLDLTALKGEWGAAFDQNMAAADRALAQFGMDSKKIKPMTEAVGGAAVVKFLSQVGQALGESKFISGSIGQNPNAVMSPAQAQAAIREKSLDAGWVKRYTERDGATVKEMETLQKWAHPESA